MRLKCSSCGEVFSGRRDAKYCSDSCRVRSFRAVTENQGGSRTPTSSSADTKRVTAGDTKVGEACVICGVTVRAASQLMDRRAQFPEIYGPAATQSIYANTLG